MFDFQVVGYADNGETYCAHCWFEQCDASEATDLPIFAGQECAHELSCSHCGETLADAG